METKANWPMWSKMRLVPLWKAIALIHGFEPELHLVQLKSPPKNGFVGLAPDQDYVEKFSLPELQETAEIMQSHIGTIDSFTVTESPNIHSHLENIVDLPSIGSWAIRNGYSISEHFPKKIVAPTNGESNKIISQPDQNNISIPKKHCPKKLEVLIKVAQKASENEEYSTNMIKEIIANECRNSNVSMVESAIKVAASIINNKESKQKKPTKQLEKNRQINNLPS